MHPKSGHFSPLVPLFNHVTDIIHLFHWNRLLASPTATTLDPLHHRKVSGSPFSEKFRSWHFSDQTTHLILPSHWRQNPKCLTCLTGTTWVSPCYLSNFICCHCPTHSLHTAIHDPFLSLKIPEPSIWGPLCLFFILQMFFPKCLHGSVFYRKLIFTSLQLTSFLFPSSCWTSLRNTHHLIHCMCMHLFIEHGLCLI